MHEFLCRHRLPDELLHQLVHVSLEVFVVVEPNFPLCAAAEELLATIFGRFDALRGSLAQELLVRAPKLPSGKRARRFLLPVAEDSPEAGLSAFGRLLLRLVQSTCLPLGEVPGSEVAFDELLARRSAAQASVAQLAGGLLQRLLVSRPRDEEARAILDELVDELLLAAFKPPWPGALALIRALAQHLIAIAQPERAGRGRGAAAGATSSTVGAAGGGGGGSGGGDIAGREGGVKLLGKIATRLWQHQVQAAKGHVQLPSWSEAPREEIKEQRLLQNVALRVSLDEGRELPWSEAARAVEAWNAELYLPEGAEEGSGLGQLTDEITFMYLTMAHLQDEQLACGFRFPPAEVDGGAPHAALGAAVFSAAHPVHAWSFLVADWAEAFSKAKQSKDSASGAKQPGPSPAKKQSKASRSLSKASAGEGQCQGEVMERFLAGVWTSPNMFRAEGASWRSSGGRRVLMAFPVYKVYRQLRSYALQGLRNAMLDCLVRQANAPQAMLRRTAMRALSDIVDADAAVLSVKLLEETVEMRLRDESSWVRQVTLELLGRVLENGLEESAASAGPGSAETLAGASEKASAMLLRFHATVRGRINDTSVVVRRQASKILSAFLLNHPDHPEGVQVAHDLMRRSSDSEQLRNLVLGTFELLWFMDEEPSPRAALQLARVVDAAGTMDMAPHEILQELLARFKSNIGARKRTRGFDFALRRWTTLLLNEFVQPTLSRGEPRVRLVTDASEYPPKEDRTEAELSIEELTRLHKRALLSALEAFAMAQPLAMIGHLRPLTVYLALEEGSTSEEQWVAAKVCRILSAVLPKIAERRGLIDHRQVQQDLQALIRSQPATGVREAVCCLCLVIKYITGDLGQLLVHLNSAVPALSQLCAQADAKQIEIGRIQSMYMSRQLWVLSAILESLDIDEYIRPADTPPEAAERRRVLPRSALKFAFVGGSVASTVADLVIRLFALGQPQLQAVSVTCLGFFLRGQRSFVKDRRINDVLTRALASSDLALCLKALEALSSLLGFFGRAAEGEATGGASSSPAPTAGAASALEAAQPLSAFGEAALMHIALAGGVDGVKKRSSGSGDAKARQQHSAADVVRVRVEALGVVRHLHQQGLMNPMIALPRVFSLCFCGESCVAEPAAALLKEMLELRPSLLLNRLDEAFREAFLALHASGHPATLGAALAPAQAAGLGEVYAERFRRQKAPREAFIRKSLREICRLQAGRFHERFTELAAATSASDSAMRGRPASTASASSAPPPVPPPRSKRRRSAAGGAVDDEGGGGAGEAAPSNPAVASTARGASLRRGGVAGLDSLPLLQQHQVLYAQFVASALCCLPFIYESEPLLLVYECNHHLALQAGTFVAAPAATAAAGRAAGAAASKAGGAGGALASGEEGALAATAPLVDFFAEAVSIAACLVLKKALKAAYGLSDELCAQFNPREVKQERLRCFPGALSAGTRSGAVLGIQPPSAEEVAGVVRPCFPTEEWCRAVGPIMQRCGNSAAIGAHMRALMEEDAWDASRGRYEAELDRLEGRARKKPRRQPLATAGGAGGARGGAEERRAAEALSAGSGRGGARGGRGAAAGRRRGRGGRVAAAAAAAAGAAGEGARLRRQGGKASRMAELLATPEEAAADAAAAAAANVAEMEEEEALGSDTSEDGDQQDDDDELEEGDEDLH